MYIVFYMYCLSFWRASNLSIRLLVLKIILLLFSMFKDDYKFYSRIVQRTQTYIYTPLTCYSWERITPCSDNDPSNIFQINESQRMRIFIMHENWLLLIDYFNIRTLLLIMDFYSSTKLTVEINRVRNNPMTTGNIVNRLHFQFSLIGFHNYFCLC